MKETMLIVYEHDILFDFVASVLRSKHCVVVANGPELAMYVSRNYERAIRLLLIDNDMPNVSCVKLVTTLTKDRPELLVLVTSGRSRDRLGLDHSWSFIQKPFVPR